MSAKPVWTTIDNSGCSCYKISMPSNGVVVPRGKTLYLYFDESGNFDFRESGTPYFIMTCVATSRPFPLCGTLENMKLDLNEEGCDIEKFHACEDKDFVRKKVYGVLASCPSEMRVYVAYVNKRDVPEEYRKPDAIYAEVFRLLVDQIYRAERIPWVEKLICITDRLPKDATKKQVVKPLKQYMKEKFQTRGIPYCLMHHDSASDMNLQIADYFCWAAQRDLAQGKTWPINLVLDSYAKVGQVQFAT